MKIPELIHKERFLMIKLLMIFTLIVGLLVSCSLKKEYESVFFKAYISSIGYIQDYPNEGEVLVCQGKFKGRSVSSTKMIKKDSSILLENLYKKDLSIRVDVVDSDFFLFFLRDSYGTIMDANMQVVFANNDSISLSANSPVYLNSHSKIIEIIIPRFGGTIFKGSAPVTSLFQVIVSCDSLSRKVLSDYWFGDFIIIDIDTFNLDLLTVENPRVLPSNSEALKPISKVRNVVTEKYARTWFKL